MAMIYALLIAKGKIREILIDTEVPETLYSE